MPCRHARKRLGYVVPLKVPLRRLNHAIEVIARRALQMRVAARSAGFISVEEGLGPHRLHQRSDSHDLHDAFEVVGQHMQPRTLE